MILKLSPILYDAWLKAIQSPTRVTCSTPTLTDHILTSALSRVSQKGGINVGVSDHQLIFCIRKIFRIKAGCAHKYLNFRSLKNYTTDLCKETLKQVDFQTTKVLVMLVRLIQISFRN